LMLTTDRPRRRRHYRHNRQSTYGDW